MGLNFLVTKPWSKPMHHKRDWSQYNKQLVNRGKIHFWINPKLLKKWKAKKTKKIRNMYEYMDLNMYIL